MRKLLYHRGIDDSTATYVTDYVESLICAIYTIVLISRSRGVSRDNLAVIIIQSAVSISALTGGITHQFLYQVSPYETFRDAWKLVVLWRIGSSLSAFLCFGQLMLAQQIIASEGYKINKMFVQLFYFLLAIFCIILFIQCYLMLLDETDPWSLTNTFIVVYAATTVQLSIIGYCIVKRYFGRSKNIQNNNENIIENSSNFEQSDSNDCDVKQTDSDVTKPLKYKTNHVLHFFGSALFLIAGVINFFLGKSGCSDNHYDVINRCPLPRDFNHNALLHILTCVALTVTFIAQVKSPSCEKSQKFKKQNDHFCPKNSDDSEIVEIV